MSYGKLSVWASLSIVLCSSCSSNTIKISGGFPGSAGSTIYLEQVTPNKVVIDSVKASQSGKWAFKYKSMRTEPQFLNVRVGDSFVTLIAKPGEKINVSALQNIEMSYEVEGSEESKLLSQLNKSMLSSYLAIDSLYSIFNRETDDSIRKVVYSQIAKRYIEQKQHNIRFVVTNSNKMAALAALYLPMPNGVVIFGDPNDYNYFKMVADSLTPKYPKSAMVESLVRDVEQYQNRSKIKNMLSTSLSEQQLSSPDISISDMYGKQRKLSELRGKVVLLYFWSATTQNIAMLNSDLKEIYNIYSPRGFEVYQVSLDKDKALWVNSVVSQKLPWISVNDFKGTSSPTVGTYNVGAVPSNFILDREGNIVGKNIWGNELTTKIETIL